MRGRARLSIVTLGVAHMARARAFYETLGFEAAGPSQESVTFLRTAGSILTLFGWDDLAEDATVPPAGSGFRGVSCAMNLDSREAVDAEYARWVEAGAAALKPPQPVSWGGYHAYVADPDGHLWELAHNPFFPIDDTGVVHLPD